MSDNDPTPASNATGTWARWLPALTFLVGLALGAVFVGVGMSTGGDDDTAAPSASGSPADGSSPSVGPSDTSIVVPAACSEASTAVGQAVTLIRQGASYVRDFQPEKLVQVLDDLETLDSRLRSLAAQCSKVQVDQVSPSASVESPTTASPSS